VSNLERCDDSGLSIAIMLVFDRALPIFGLGGLMVAMGSAVGLDGAVLGGSLD
jgi:hypothetical protein